MTKTTNTRHTLQHESFSASNLHLSRPHTELSRAEIVETQEAAVSGETNTANQAGEERARVDRREREKRGEGRREVGRTGEVISEEGKRRRGYESAVNL